MSLCIRHTDNIENEIHTIDWNLGESLPNIDIMKIIEIEGTGREMGLILDIFHGLIPQPHKEWARWEGPMAKLIIERLRQQIEEGSI